MVTQRYYYSLQQELSFRPRQENPKAGPVVYTPLHGVGLPWLQKVPCHPSPASGLSPSAVTYCCIRPVIYCCHLLLHQACHPLLCSHLLPHQAPVRIAKSLSCFCHLSVCLSFSFLVLFLFFSLHAFSLLHSSSCAQKGVPTMSGPPPTHPSPNLLYTLPKMDMVSNQLCCC